LGEVADFSKGNGYSKSDLITEGTPIILYGRLYTNYETVIENIDTYAKMKEKSVISQGDEVIVPSSGETAEDISRASVVLKPGIILGGDLNIVKPNSTIDSAFLALTISNGNQQKELSKKAQGKSVVHLNNSDLREVILNLPLKKEQTNISNFFCILENTILLHKRKHEMLKKLKKGYLQQMFPQEGECVPRVRFKGFTEDWEERKLGDVVNVNSGKDYKHLGTGDIPVYGTGGYMLSVNDKLSDKDAIGIGRKGTIDKPQLLKAPFWTVDTLFYAIPKTENDLYFLFSMFELINWKSFDESTGVPSLSKATIVDINRMFPPLCEQTAIGKFLYNLDKQITEQQNKLNKLKQLKSAYLQKMFI